MSNLTPDETQKYRELANKHADFLCEKVFKPAFEMAFIHGAKHMKDDMLSGACDAKNPTKGMSPAEVARFNKKVEDLRGDPIR